MNRFPRIPSMLAATVLCAALAVQAAPDGRPPAAAQRTAAQALPAAAEQAARQMMAGGAGAFAVGHGRRGVVTTLARYGGMKADTAYPVASASKWLVAATVMTLVDEGRLSLDSPIATWLTGLGEDAGRITLRQLLAQTSGLAGASGEFHDLAQDHRITLAESARDLARRPLISRPGEVFAYGTGGFQLVGAVVEAVTGQRWAEVFDARIARPLGMTHTRWIHLRLDSTDELPAAETLNPVLQGGAVSTPEDYLRFLSMLSRGGLYGSQRILSAKAVDMLLTDQTPQARMTPTPASVLPDAHYALGSWCETWDTRGACQRNSSIGLFGVYPWVERGTGRFGVVFPYVRDDAFRFWPQIAAIRDAVGR
jgi:CubicO group peptidase (beta-lactamase class C family)